MLVSACKDDTREACWDVSISKNSFKLEHVLCMFTVLLIFVLHDSHFSESQAHSQSAIQQFSHQADAHGRKDRFSLLLL